MTDTPDTDGLDLDALKAVAEAVEPLQRQHWDEQISDDAAWPEVVAHMIAFSPSTVLALIAEVERLRAVTMPDEYDGHLCVRVQAYLDRCRERDEAVARAERAEAQVEKVRALVERGVGTDLTPTTLRHMESSWWYSYLDGHDRAWRDRLRAIVEPEPTERGGR